MIRVMIVEDEPAAKRFLTSLIERLCSGFEVACAADNGLDAMRWLEQNTVDIVMTDIQMAQMDGIKLADWISRERPDIQTVIVSGYNDFEYAKGAIHARVVEYMLKPIVPADFVAVMQKLREQVEHRQRLAKQACLMRAERGVDKAIGESPWREQQCWLGAIRLGGQQKDRSAIPDRLCELDDALTVVELQDERALCFVLEADKPVACAQAVVAQLVQHAAYYTASLALEKMPQGLEKLPRMMRHTMAAAVLGITQTLLDLEIPQMDPQTQAKEKAALWRLHLAIKGGMAQEAKDALAELFVCWEAGRSPLSHVEAQLRGIVQVVHDHTPHSDENSQRELLPSVSAACAQADHVADLHQRVLRLLDSLLPEQSARNDGEQLAARIQDYICAHIGEALSTQSICALFGISGSYLSQLFRKHVQQSFVEYVTLQRVEEAKRMLKQLPGMPLKEVAESLGFSDQFYFSKVFRAMTGVTPSAYRK